MNDKVDCVILFVDMEDNEWYGRYKKYLTEVKTGVDLTINHDGRLRDNKTLKYLLRSIDMYMSWINNVFLVVQSESQVPKWINRETVKVVLHEEFIPKEFLPVYNGLFLQLFLHEIKGLSNKYICLDDDMIITDKINVHHFFQNNKITQFIKEKNVNGNCGTKGYFYPVHNAHKIVYNILKDSCIISDHGALPFERKKIKFFFEKILYKNIKYCNRIVREKNDIICWVYIMNNYKNREIILEKTPLCKNFILNKNLIDEIIECLFNHQSVKYKIICINDYNIEKEEYNIVLKKLIGCLNIKFKSVCKYERIY